MVATDPQEESGRQLLDQPKEVIRRWVRFKMVAKSRALARSCARWWLPINERKRRAALIGAFDAVKEQAIKCESTGYRATSTIFNIALYFLIAERDIQAMKIDALTHPDEWKRKLCARVILLTIYEWDADKVSGSALRAALDEIAAPNDVRKEAVDALRAVRLVQRRSQRELQFLRNSTIAHRDPDALVQFRAISNMQTDEVFRIAGDFYEASDRFIALLPRLMTQSSSISALLRQLAASSRKP